MNKEQAIKIINDLIQNGFTNFGGREPLSAEETDAFEIAIKALEQQPSEDCVSRQAVVEYIKDCNAELGDSGENELVVEDILNMPPVTPTHGTCKDCKHWKDSDGVYRRGISAESKCPLNILQVFDGDFYCADFKKRGNKVGWSSLENVREKVERGSENG